MTWDIERFDDFSVTSPGDRVLSGFPPRYLMYIHLSKLWHCEIHWGPFVEVIVEPKITQGDMSLASDCRKHGHMYPEGPGSIRDRCFSERAMNNLSHIPTQGWIQCPRLNSVLFSIISKNTKENWSWINFSFNVNTFSITICNWFWRNL